MFRSRISRVQLRNRDFGIKMGATWILILLFITIGAGKGSAQDAPPSREGTTEMREKLFDKLMTGYKRGVNPDSPNVEFGISLIDVDIDEDRSTLESNVWMKIIWYDSRLKWDTAEYPVELLRMEYDNLWQPDITLYNSADLSTTASACWESNVLVYPSGKVLWVPPCHFSSFCKLTLKTAPYAEQTCFLKFGSWTFDSEILNLNFYRNISAVDLADFWDLSDWKVVSTTGAKNIKQYECCPEPYADLTFNLTLARKPASDSLCTA